MPTDTDRPGGAGRPGTAPSSRSRRRPGSISWSLARFAGKRPQSADGARRRSRRQRHLGRAMGCGGLRRLPGRHRRRAAARRPSPGHVGPFTFGGDGPGVPVRPSPRPRASCGSGPRRRRWRRPTGGGWPCRCRSSTPRRSSARDRRPWWSTGPAGMSSSWIISSPTASRRRWPSRPTARPPGSSGRTARVVTRDRRTCPSSHPAR